MSVGLWNVWTLVIHSLQLRCYISQTQVFVLIMDIRNVFSTPLILYSNVFTFLPLYFIAKAVQADLQADASRCPYNPGRCRRVCGDFGLLFGEHLPLLWEKKVNFFSWHCIMQLTDEWKETFTYLSLGPSLPSQIELARVASSRVYFKNTCLG